MDNQQQQVPIPFKRESPSQTETLCCTLRTELCFNSLQTGKPIANRAVQRNADRRNVSIPFKRESAWQEILAPNSRKPVCTLNPTRFFCQNGLEVR